MIRDPGHNTANGERYRDPNADVVMNPEGMPIAFRRVRVLQPGTFAGACKLQLVTPSKVYSHSWSLYEGLRKHCTPLN